VLHIVLSMQQSAKTTLPGVHGSPAISSHPFVHRCDIESQTSSAEHIHVPPQPSSPHVPAKQSGLHGPVSPESSVTNAESSPPSLSSPQSAI